MKQWKRGEIATVLTIGALLVIGVSTLVSSLLISKSKQTTRTKAQEATCEEGAYSSECTGENAGCGDGFGEARVSQCSEGQWVEVGGECQSKCQTRTDSDRQNTPDPACIGRNPGEILEYCVREDCDANINRKVCIERFCDGISTVQEKVGAVTERSCLEGNGEESGGGSKDSGSGGNATPPSRVTPSTILAQATPPPAGGSTPAESEPTNNPVPTTPVSTRPPTQPPTAVPTSPPTTPASCDYFGGTLPSGRTACNDGTGTVFVCLNGDLSPVLCTNGCSTVTNQCNPAPTSAPTSMPTSVPTNVPTQTPSSCSYLGQGVPHGKNICVNQNNSAGCNNGYLNVEQCGQGQICNSSTGRCTGVTPTTAPLPGSCVYGSSRIPDGTSICVNQNNSASCINGSLSARQCGPQEQCNSSTGRCTPVPTNTPTLRTCVYNGNSYQCNLAGNVGPAQNTCAGGVPCSLFGQCPSNSGGACLNVTCNTSAGRSIACSGSTAAAAPQAASALATNKTASVYIDNSCEIEPRYTVGLSKIDQNKEVIVGRQPLGSSVKRTVFTIPNNNQDINLYAWLVYRVKGESQDKYITSGTVLLQRFQQEANLSVTITCK